MKKFFIAGMTGLFLMAGISAVAQLNGLINKGKNKLSEVKTLTGNVKGQGGNGQSGKENSGMPAIETVNDNAVPVNNRKQETKFEFATDEGYTTSSFINYDVKELEREKPIGPYRHIRKVGEKGNFHFAKDYPELAGVADPELKDFSISFSSTPFKGGSGTPATQFSSSSGNIYARLETKGRSIKEAFHISGDILKLSMDVYLYPVGSNEIRFRKAGVVSILYLTAEQAAKSVLDFDIKPSVKSITPYYNPKDRYSYYLSTFPLIHNQQFFTGSGKYMVGIRVVAEQLNEWGVFLGNTLEAMGSFAYDFNVADAKNVYAEGEEVTKILQTGMRRLPKPMPAQWKMNSAASVVAGYSVARYNQLYQGFYKDVKIVKTVLIPVSGATWKVVSNDNIIPTYKYCTQTVYFFVKDKEGNCYYHPCDLRQDYSGGGTYGPVHLAVFDEEKVYVKCEEMK